MNRNSLSMFPAMTRSAAGASLTVIALLAVLSLPGCDGRPRAEQEGGGPKLTGSGHVAVIDLENGAPETTVGTGFLPLSAGRTYLALIRRLADLRDDKDAAAVFVRLGGGAFGMTRSREVGLALEKLRQAKKPVVCHAEQLDNAAMWLVSRGCDQVWVEAAGDVPTVGLAAELSYLKGAFDKVGIQADMLAMGKYKSGGEALTRTEPSEPSLRNLEAMLHDLREQWLSGTTQGSKNPAAMREQLEDGPWTPQKAKELGLIDEVGFRDEAEAAAQEAGKTSEMRLVFGLGAKRKQESATAQLVRMLAGAPERTGGRKHIAVVPALGSITMSAGGPFAAPGITAEAMTKTLERLREDEAVGAIVLRMDSPGGSPLASDLIWREMMLTRKEKPVIVSIGSMSASGGYYIASGGTKIVSSPTAIVGSIGVFGGKIVLEGAFDKAGITTYPVPASPEPGAAARALHMSPTMAWDEPTRERVRQSMKRIYDLFVARVATGRGMDKKDVYATAEGAIFLAPVGKERGLVDELGGLERSLEIARQEAGLDDDVPVTIEGPSESVLEALLLGPGADASEVEAALSAYQRRLATATLGPFDSQVLSRLQPFAAAVEPMLAGEHVIAALPFALRMD